jgi:hypothetical protein
MASTAIVQLVFFGSPYLIGSKMSESSATGNCFSNFALLALSNAALCFSDIGFFFLASASFARLRSAHALKPSSVFDLESSAAFQQRSQIPLMFFVCRPQCHLQVLIALYLFPE